MSLNMLFKMFLSICCIVGVCISGVQLTMAADVPTHTTAVFKLSAGDAATDTPVLGEDTRLVQLANGLTVLVKTDRRFPMVSTRLMVHAGSAYETPQQAGISHLLEHMVFKGTTERPKGEISRVVEAAGGYLNAATSFDYTQYITDLPSREWRLGVDVVRDMAFNATLDAKELESEKNVVVAELKRGEDSPHGRLFKLAQTAALRGSAYARPIIGFEDSIRGISVQDMRDYIQTYYQPRNMLLVVVGDVHANEVLAEAERLFGKYTNTSALQMVQPIDVTTLEQGAATINVQQGPWNKVYLSMTVPVPGFEDAEATPLDVLAHLLGGDETSYLYKKYKYQEQLVDSISVSNLSFERVGMFLISAQLDADKLQPFWDAITKDLHELKADRFTEQEMERARLNLVDSLYRSKETLPSLASNLTLFQFFLGGEQGEINAVQAVQAVDKHAVQRVIETWLQPSRLSVVALCPQEHVEKAATLRAVLHKNWPANALVHPSSTAQRGEAEVVDLGNNRTVVFIPDTTRPYFSMSLAFSGGEALLEPVEQGLAALTARTLTTGTQRLNNAALQEFLSDRAAAVGASTGRKTFYINMDAPSRFMDDLLPVFVELLNQPAFSGDEVEREQKSQIAAIKTTEDQPLGLAFRKLPAFLFPQSVYGYETLGTAQNVQAMTANTVKDYWKRQHTRPWVLAVAGDFNKETVLRFAKQLPVPTAEKVSVALPQWGTDKELTLALPDRKQAHLLLVFKTAPKQSPETPALMMTEAALGGMGGPLFAKLRDEQGLGYSVTVFNTQNDELGYMAFYIGTNPEQLEKAQASFTQIISDIRTTPLANQDLSRGFNQLEGTYYRSMQSLSARAHEAAGLLMSGRPLDFAKQELAKSQNVTPEAIQKAAQAYLNPEEAYIVTVLPE